MLINELSKAFSNSPPLFSKSPSLQKSSVTMEGLLILFRSFCMYFCCICLVLVSHNPPLIINQNNSLDSEAIQNDRCRICLENDIDCVLLECGHLVSCSTCAVRFTTCPFCRTPIVRIQRIFRT